MSRCESIIIPSRTGRRCKRSALPGTNPPRCEIHVLARARKTDPNYMPRFYTDTLRPALAAHVERMLEEAATADLLSIDEEVVLVKRAARDVVAMWSAAVETGNAEAIRVAGIAMTSVLDDSTKIVARCASIEESRARVRGPMVTALETLIKRLTRIAYDVFGEDHRVRELERQLRADLRVTQAMGGGPGGTSLLPTGESVDDAALQMDSTVPEE